jgi:uncharacterized membrane protein YgdD (TMEM256/DUF423 family)
VSRLWLFLGAANAFCAVAAGAFGAHGLRARVEPGLLEVWKTGAQYQMYHALAMLVVAQLATQRPAAACAGWAMLGGVVLFSGSLYGLVLSGVRGLGAVTPVGGVAFLVGWVILAVVALRR